MRTPDEREIALQCLMLANHPDVDDERVVVRARAFFDFVTGGTPREQIDAALDRAGVK